VDISLDVTKKKVFYIKIQLSVILNMFCLGLFENHVGGVLKEPMEGHDRITNTGDKSTFDHSKNKLKT
jgi:hypothetical protein